MIVESCLLIPKSKASCKVMKYYSPKYLTNRYDKCSIELKYNTCHMGVLILNVKVDKISEAEAEIMRVIWEYKLPVTYSHIRTVLTQQKEWESPTVNTLVNRLVKKGVLIQDKKEVYYYTAVISEKEYTQAKTKSFIQKVYGGNVKGLMSALLTYEDITQEDLAELRSQWKNGGKQHE